MIRSARERLLAGFAAVEGPAAWVLLAGAAVTFVGVLVRLIDVGDFRLGTLLIAADLLVAGFSAVQQHEDVPAPSTIGCPVCGRPLPFSTVRMFTVNGSTHAEIDVAECDHNPDG